MSDVRRPVRVANCSGFFGDRLSAAREMVDGGDIDVLTGDWLAELTMLILARQRMKHGAGSGYARTFLTQMADVLGDCLDRGIRVVSNAGGLDPAGCAAALREQAAAAGLTSLRIAWVEGDDLMPRLGELTESGEQWVNLDTGQTLAEAGVHPLTANAYIGGRAIAQALDEGADVVITGRCTDAALVVGPAAWWQGWSFDSAEPADLARLAGAVVAGHIIECGAQATGGNYSFFDEVPGIEHIGFPLAEVAADGSSVITKHEGTGGLVSVGTVTAQLLYEIGGPRYANPDVVARFDTIELEQVGADRVRVSGVVGEPAPERLKVALNYLGGFRNSMTLVLTGLDVELKADVVLRQVAGLTLAQCLDGRSPAELAAASRLGVAELLVRFVKRGSGDPLSVEQAQSLLQISVKDSDPKRAGRVFTSGVVEAALSSYPGMFPTAPPGEATPFGAYWPTTVAASTVTDALTLHHDPHRGHPSTHLSHSMHPVAEAVSDDAASLGRRSALGAYLGAPDAEMVRVALGALVGARSGDKGGNANIGVWVAPAAAPRAAAPAAAPARADAERVSAAVGWLTEWLTPDRVRQLLPEATHLAVDCHPLPNLNAVNVVIHGILGRGVADSDSLDPQAKGLGEQLRARLVDVPVRLLDPTRLARHLEDTSP